MAVTCTHLHEIRDVIPATNGCVDCLAIGDTWVHLRLCMSCGYVGCCDSSRNKHATAHARSSRHPIIQSYEPGQDWYWCYIERIMFVPEDAPSYSHP